MVATRELCTLSWARSVRRDNWNRKAVCSCNVSSEGESSQSEVAESYSLHPHLHLRLHPHPHPHPHQHQDTTALSLSATATQVRALPEFYDKPWYDHVSIHNIDGNEPDYFTCAEVQVFFSVRTKLHGEEECDSNFGLLLEYRNHKPGAPPCLLASLHAHLPLPLVVQVQGVQRYRVVSVESISRGLWCTDAVIANEPTAKWVLQVDC